MKIYGTGVDLIHIGRIKLILKRNKNVKKRLFSNLEISFCEKKKNKYSCYAKRFAAKEAFSKSLGTGISRGIRFNEIQVKNNINGMPFLEIIGNSSKTVNKILNTKKFNTYLSLSDDKSIAIAYVITTTL
jgi:holo-[acyl-carrier protein] synthase